MRKMALIALFAILLSSCSMKSKEVLPTVTDLPTVTLTNTLTSTPVPSSTVTPTSTIIPTKTVQSTPTIKPTWDIVAKNYNALPEKPEGFEWKGFPDLDLIVLFPDGWYFKEEDRDLGFEGFYITRENIDEVGRFSTGMSVMVFELDNADDAEEFSLQLLAVNAQADTTAEVLRAYDYETGNTTLHHLRIRGEFPYETKENQDKIIHYVCASIDRNVYYILFESPTEIWDEMMERYGVYLLDYIVILQKLF